MKFPIFADGKSQVTIEYRDGRPFRVEAVDLDADRRCSYRDDPKGRTRESDSATIDPNLLMDEKTNISNKPNRAIVVVADWWDAGVTGRR